LKEPGAFLMTGPNDNKTPGGIAKNGTDTLIFHPLQRITETTRFEPLNFEFVPNFEFRI
jgi:hypothetical protein